MIVIGRWTGREASALKEALRMTIRDFADYLGAAVRTVANWEEKRAKIVPAPEMQAALDTALRRASDETKAIFEKLLAGEDPEEDKANRRDATKSIAAGIVALAQVDTVDLFAWLTAQRSRTDRVDDTLIATHEEIAAVLAGWYRSADPRAVLPMAAAYADTVLELFHRATSDRNRARLVLVAVGAHAQTGLWACHAGMWAKAHQYLATACDLAASSGSPSLHAQALGALSYLFSSAPRGGRGGDPVRALELLDQAIDLAHRADGFTRGWLATWRADQHAALGDVDAANIDADTAERGLTATDDGTEGFFSRLTYGYGMSGHLGSVQAVAVGLDGKQRESDETFERVLSSAANLRRQASTYGHLAMVRARRGELDGACDALVQAMNLAAPAGYAMGLERVVGIRASFDPCWSCDPRVQELDEQLRLLTTRS